MTGVALLIVFVVFIPAIWASAAAFTTDWFALATNQSLAHAPPSRVARLPSYLNPLISDCICNATFTSNRGFLAPGLQSCAPEIKFDNLLIPYLRIRGMLSLLSSQSTLSPN
jgi:hypothetical protein